MSNVVKFDPKVLPTLPEYLRALPKSGRNEDVLDGLSGGFVAPPRISIEGKVFRVVQDGVSRPLTRINEETGQEEPVQSLNVVVLRANKGKYKLFYGTKYDPDAEAEAPTCYSYDGITPSLFATEAQSETCATCQHNKWGSEVTDAGKKTRACSDNKILAVIPLSAVTNKSAADSVQGQAYALKVSPTALSRNREDRNAEPQNNTSLHEYVSLLDAYPTQEGSAEVPLSNVATRLFFEIKSQYPLLRFRLSRFLTEEEIAYVETRLDGEDLTRIIADQGQGPVPTRAPQLPEKEKPKVLKGPPKDEGADDFTPPLQKTSSAAEPAPAPTRRGRPPVKKEETTPAKRERVKPEEAGEDVDAAIAKLGSLFD